jgi:hypothetical protein
MKIKLLFLAIVLITLTTGCASIFSKSSYPISIKSNPDEAKIVIKDKNGVEIFTGLTPASLQLKASSGFFERARYQVTFTKNGYDTRTVPIEFKVDGWYFGNLLIGGFIGMLIVDPATGAMYKLETEFLNETLVQSTTNVDSNQLNAYTLDEIPKGCSNHLVKVSD